MRLAAMARVSRFDMILADRRLKIARFKAAAPHACPARMATLRFPGAIAYGPDSRQNVLNNGKKRYPRGRGGEGGIVKDVRQMEPEGARNHSAHRRRWRTLLPGGRNT